MNKFADGNYSRPVTLVLLAACYFVWSVILLFFALKSSTLGTILVSLRSLLVFPGHIVSAVLAVLFLFSVFSALVHLLYGKKRYLVWDGLLIPALLVSCYTLYIIHSIHAPSVITPRDIHGSFPEIWSYIR